MVQKDVQANVSVNVKTSILYDNVLPIYIILKNENKELSQKSKEGFWLIFIVQVKFVIL